MYKNERMFPKADWIRVKGTWILKHVVELVAEVGVFRIVVYPGVATDEGVLPADVKSIVDFPVDVPNFAGGMEQPLKKDQI